MMKNKKTGVHVAKSADARSRRGSRPEHEKESDSFLSETPEEMPAYGISSSELVQETREESRERRRKAKQSKGGKGGITAVIILLVASVLTGIVGFLGYRITNSPANLPNVYVNGIFVGGLTPEQTAAVLDENKWDEAAAASLKVELLKGVDFEIGMCESGTLLTKENAVEAAYRYGHSGNWFENFLTYAAGIFGHADVNERETAVNSGYIRERIEEALKKQDELYADRGYAVDEEKSILTMVKGAGQIKMDADSIYSAVLTALENNEKKLSWNTLSAEPKMPDFQKIYDELAIEPVDAYYDPETKSVVDNVDGFLFDVKTAERAWNDTAIGETVSVPVTITVPEVTRESLEALLFRDVLGSQETLYFTYDSNRCNNLHLAIGKIDGIILNPGEEFSYNDVVGQRTEEAGFLPAGAYDNGEVVQEIGGGVCQISSTLYSACLYSQLEILERTCHQFKVDYLDYSMDATVSWPSPNFRFRNNRDYPIKIHAYYNDEHDAYNHQGGVAVEILGTDVDGSYVTIRRETWMIPHPEFPDICIGYSVLQYRDIHAADGTVIRTEAYDYLDDYYFHSEDYADKVEARRGEGGGEDAGGEVEIDFG